LNLHGQHPTGKQGFLSSIYRTEKGFVILIGHITMTACMYIGKLLAYKTTYRYK